MGDKPTNKPVKQDVDTVSQHKRLAMGGSPNTGGRNGTTGQKRP